MNFFDLHGREQIEKQKELGIDRLNRKHIVDRMIRCKEGYIKIDSGGRHPIYSMDYCRSNYLSLENDKKYIYFKIDTFFDITEEMFRAFCSVETTAKYLWLQKYGKGQVTGKFENDGSNEYIVQEEVKAEIKKREELYKKIDIYKSEIKELKKENDELRKDNKRLKKCRRLIEEIKKIEL